MEEKKLGRKLDKEEGRKSSKGLKQVREGW